MGYSRKIHDLASRELERRRDNAINTQKRRYAEVTEVIPELRDIEKEMSSTGLAVVRAIGMGEDAQKYIEKLAQLNLSAQSRRKQLLESAGYTEDYLEITYTCCACKDTGTREGRACDCRKALLRTFAFAQLSELSPAESCTFESFDVNYYPKAGDGQSGVSPYTKMKEIYDFCRNYAEDFDTDSPNLYMFGKTGLGKTHLSLAIAGTVVNKGFGVIYGAAQNLLNRLERERFGRSVSNDGHTEQALLDCDLLILDDLGAEFSTTFTVAALYNIINTRLSRNKTTIISTNLTAAELEDKYTQRIASRITGNYIPLNFIGRDVRQLKRRR